MLNQFSRTELLIGKEGIKKLNNSKVAIFGLGGVGSFVLEGLVRAGIQNFILVDNDTIDITNLNRQILATTKTIGLPKVELAKQRILEINPKANVKIHQEFFMPNSKDLFDNTTDYIVDCIDTVTAKIELVIRANKLNIPIISSMGTANKLDPTKLEISDIYKTSICPLSKVMRKELRSQGIKKLKVVYSKEKPEKQEILEKTKKQEKQGNQENILELSSDNLNKKVTKRVLGSISFVPSVAGLIISSEVVKDLIKL